MEELGRKRDVFTTVHGPNQDAPRILTTILGTA
jgi:hypothetical protein